MIGLTKALARAGRPSQEDFKLGCPRCSGCCTVPDRHSTGPSGRRAIIMIQSAVTVPGGIMTRLTEALARASRPSQDDFKLGGPRCCSSCTVPGCCHRTGPLGQRSNISLSLSVVTVQGVCPEQDRIHRITGSCWPGVPLVPVNLKYLHEFIDINGYLHLDILFKMWISIDWYGYP